MLLEETIEELEVGHRFKNALYRNGIKTIHKVTQYSASELLSVKGLGPKGVNEIKQALEGLGLKLKDEGVLRAGRHTLCVTRVSYSTKYIEIEVDGPIGFQELKVLGEERAKNMEFSDKESEYYVDYVKESGS